MLNFENNLRINGEIDYLPEDNSSSRLKKKKKKKYKKDKIDDDEIEKNSIENNNNNIKEKEIFFEELSNLVFNILHDNSFVPMHYIEIHEQILALNKV